MLSILYQDAALVIINKPSGILVHKTRLSEDKIFVLQQLRDQLGGAHLYPVHRLDRATSGVLVFARTSEVASELGEQLMDFKWAKTYLAIVRGHVHGQATIDYPLTDEETGITVPQQAITHYRTLGQSVLPWAIGLRYPTARFSLVEVQPETGRRQQIRKHFAHIRHPVINDTRHGDVKHTNYFRLQGFPGRLLLHAWELEIPHPSGTASLKIQAPLDKDFMALAQQLELAAYLPALRPITGQF